jgi:hypothetical protein
MINRLMLLSVAALVGAVSSAGAADMPTPAGATAIAAPDKDAPAKIRYAALLRDIDGIDKKCIALNPDSSISQENKEALKSFVPLLQFIEVHRGKPIRLSIPGDYYNPQGTTIVVDSVELAVNRGSPGNAYFSLRQTADGLRIAARAVVSLNDNLLCAGEVYVSIPFEGE